MLFLEIIVQFKHTDVNLSHLFSFNLLLLSFFIHQDAFFADVVTLYSSSLACAFCSDSFVCAFPTVIEGYRFWVKSLSTPTFAFGVIARSVVLLFIRIFIFLGVIGQKVLLVSLEVFGLVNRALRKVTHFHNIVCILIVGLDVASSRVCFHGQTSCRTKKGRRNSVAFQPIKM